MAYHRPIPRGSTHVEASIWQTTRGKYVCHICGSFNWSLENMRRHVATPHHPCPWCHESFVTLGAHTWKCPRRPGRAEPRQPRQHK